MQEIGRITKIAGRTVTIQGGEIGGCFGCMNEECKTNGKVFTAENRKDLELAIGELVEVTVAAADTASNAALAFLPPLACFIGAFALTAAALPASTEAARAAAGVVGLTVGFAGVYFFRRAKPAKAVPIVSRKVDEAESVEDD